MCIGAGDKDLLATGADHSERFCLKSSFPKVRPLQRGDNNGDWKNGTGTECTSRGVDILAANGGAGEKDTLGVTDLKGGLMSSTAAIRVSCQLGVTKSPGQTGTCMDISSRGVDEGLK